MDLPNISATPAISASQRKNAWLEQYVHTLANKPGAGIEYYTQTSLSAPLLQEQNPTLGLMMNILPLGMPTFR